MTLKDLEISTDILYTLLVYLSTEAMNLMEGYSLVGTHEHKILCHKYKVMCI